MNSVTAKRPPAAKNFQTEETQAQNRERSVVQQSRCDDKFVHLIYTSETTTPRNCFELYRCCRGTACINSGSSHTTILRVRAAVVRGASRKGKGQLLIN